MWRQGFLGCKSSEVNAGVAIVVLHLLNVVVQDARD